MLTGFWYRALPSEKIKHGQLQKAMLLEIPLVTGRDRIGKAFALRDACPHRGMPLSCGRFDGEQYFAVPQEHLTAAFQCAYENAAQPVALRLHPRAPLTDEKRTTGDVMRDG